MNWNVVLLIVGALLVLVEVALGGFAGFDLVLIGSAFLLGGGLGLLFGSTALGLIVASVACVAYIAVGRRWVRRRMTHRVIPSNADALVGVQGRVMVRIAVHEPGQVKVKDEVWRAVPAPGAAESFEPGAVVTVDAVDGVTLIVR
jgi:membrane protein implicated in regulation of membrane protease activity